MSSERGRHRSKPQANHNLFLRGGVWWTRFERDGRALCRSTRCPKSEVATARRIRDERLAAYALRCAGIEPPPPAPDPLPIGKLIGLYLDEQSRPYDREKGGKQGGTKRSASQDRANADRLKKAGLDFGLAADHLDTARIFDVGEKLEGMGFAGLTRRNTLRFLRCVYGWARRARNKAKTGVSANPFDDLDPADRARLFPKDVSAKAPPFTREQLRAICDRLPSYASLPVRFAAHSGMRWHSELIRMVWGRVDFEKRVYPVDPRWAKRGKERDVPLSDVALSILNSIRPENSGPDDPVWLNAKGGPLHGVRRSYERAVQKVCPTPRPGWRYPDFHSLRRTCASALAEIAPTSVVGAVLGHSKESSVTDRYITVPMGAQIAALNRAALLIDGDEKENVAIFPGTVQKAAFSA
jgi:integrase